MTNYFDQSDWFTQFNKSDEYEIFFKKPVAYFCSEYALDPLLPIYAGGLGVLAGDFVMETAMRGFPLVSVGLFYKKAQSILSLAENPHKSKLKNVVDKNNLEIIVTIPIEDRVVRVKAWLWEEEGAKVYLLDTDIRENDIKDRLITQRLYDEDRDIRLKQEIVLGIGGFRLLDSLGYHSSAYHLNEGHSAFLALELVRHEMEHQQVSFSNACEFAKKHILFTNHTLVPEGQEKFLPEKVGLFLAKYAGEMGLKIDDIVNLGISQDTPDLFSMTTLSFKLSTKSNAVSKLHKEKAKIIWPDQISDNITNGIFLKRWDKVGDLPTVDIKECHLNNKRNLLALVKEQTGEIWGETDLILVWARRLVQYKQPLFFLDNPDKLLEISRNSPVPIRIIFSGPTGETENSIVTRIKKIIEEKLKGIVVFIPNYNMATAEILTAGGDIWLNTPTPGTEACGTSGMKAGLNGVLSLSTNDGWVNEVNPSDIGWVVNGSHEEQEAAMFSLLEKEIIPLYSYSLKDSKDKIWVGKMENVRNFIRDNFSTSRVLKEYIEKLYIPILRQKHAHKYE